MELYIKEEKKKNRKGDWFLFALSILLLVISGTFFVFTEYPSFFETRVNTEKNDEISPKDSVVINFSRPAVENYPDWKIEIYPKTNFDYHLENSNKKLVIKPKEYWNPEYEYTINISGRNYFLLPFAEALHFKTASYPKVTGFYPSEGSKDVLLDIEDPIKVDFDKSIDGFNVKFVVSPDKELGSKLSDDKKQISLMTNGDLERGQKYTIDTFIRYKEEPDSRYKKVGSTSFETKPLPQPQVWEKDFNARLEQAKNFTDPQIRSGRYIDINLKSQIMVIFEEGKVLDAYMISSGKRGMETPEGSYKISNKTPRAWSKEYGLFMPYWQALVPSGKFGIHELPEWPGGYKEGANHLGTPVSHGCVRLGVGPAERVYNFTEIGTPVIVHY